MDEGVFRTTKVDNWDYHQCIGFFRELDKVLFYTDETDWGYIYNFSGDFPGCWRHFRNIKKIDVNIYMQFEFNRLVIKLGEVYGKQVEIRNLVTSKLIHLRDKYHISGVEPTRHGVGTTMTLLVIARKEWYIKHTDGTMNFDETINSLKRLSTLLIDELADEIIISV